MMARTTTRRKVKKNKQQTQIRKAIVGLCLVVGLGALLIVAWADMLPHPAPTVPPAPNSVATAQPQADTADVSQALPADSPSSQTTPPSRRSADFYSQGIRDSMFSPPQPPAPKPAAPAPAPAPEAPDPSDLEPSIVPETPVNPFVDWSYNGLVTMGDEKMALLENTKTKEGQYVQTGDTFLSAKVEDVTEQVVSLRASGKTYTLPKSDTITVVPLDKNAPYLSENSSPPQPGNSQGAQAQALQTSTAPNGMANGLADQFNAMQQYRRQFRGMGRGRRMGGGFNPQQMNLPPGP